MGAEFDGNILVLDLRMGLASLMQRGPEIYLQRMDDLLDCQVRGMGVSSL